MPLETARLMSRRMSSRCSRAVFRSWPVTWRKEPFVSRFITWPPAFPIQSREAAVHEAQGFHGVEPAAGEGPGADLGKGFLLAAGNPRRGNLDPVDLQFFQQQARDRELLVRIERDAGGLLAVTEGGIKDFDHFCS